MFKISTNIINTLSNAFPLIETSITNKNINIGDVQIKRGIFQGDFLSPLLFIMSLAPLSVVLNKENRGFKFTDPTENLKLHISHLLFVDDITLRQHKKTSKISSA